MAEGVGVGVLVLYISVMLPGFCVPGPWVGVTRLPVDGRISVKGSVYIGLRNCTPVCENAPRSRVGLAVVDVVGAVVA